MKANRLQRVLTLFRRLNREQKVDQLTQKMLAGRVNTVTLRIALARAQRHVAEGRTPEDAAHIATLWALGARHPSWMR